MHSSNFSNFFSKLYNVVYYEVTNLIWYEYEHLNSINFGIENVLSVFDEGCSKECNNKSCYLFFKVLSGTLCNIASIIEERLSMNILCMYSWL